MGKLRILQIMRKFKKKSFDFIQIYTNIVIKWFLPDSINSSGNFNFLLFLLFFSLARSPHPISKYKRLLDSSIFPRDSENSTIFPIFSSITLFQFLAFQKIEISPVTVACNCRIRLTSYISWFVSIIFHEFSMS